MTLERWCCRKPVSGFGLPAETRCECASVRPFRQPANLALFRWQSRRNSDVILAHAWRCYQRLTVRPLRHGDILEKVSDWHCSLVEGLPPKTWPPLKPNVSKFCWPELNLSNSMFSTKSNRSSDDCERLKAC
jgi:hypothetical protein